MNTINKDLVKKCGCGQFQFYQVVHRVDLPCYMIEPDKFQKRECECSCRERFKCSHAHSCCIVEDHYNPCCTNFEHQPHRDEVEKKINLIKSRVQIEYDEPKPTIYAITEKELRELVRLAKEAK